MPRWVLSLALTLIGLIAGLSASAGASPATELYGVELHSGALHVSVVDLHLPGPGLGVVLARTYRSDTVGARSLGPGWTFGYDVRLRPLPDGSVELWRGGRVERFEPSPRGYEAPRDVFAALTRVGSGWLLIEAAAVACASTRRAGWSRSPTVCTRARSAAVACASSTTPAGAWSGSSTHSSEPGSCAPTPPVGWSRSRIRRGACFAMTTTRRVASSR